MIDVACYGYANAVLEAQNVEQDVLSEDYVDGVA